MTRLLSAYAVPLICASLNLCSAQSAELCLMPGTLMGGVGISYTNGWGKRADLGSASLTVDYFVFQNFSLGGELTGFRASQPGKDADGLNFSGVLRHHLLRWENGSAFLDASFGPVETDQRIPAGGTRFNFMTRFGPGVMFQLKPDDFLLTGLRYWHLSNAQIEGVHRNPAINGLQIYVQLMHSW